MSRRKALAPCSVSGCPTLTMNNRCEKHEQAADLKRGTAAERGYDSTWRKTRKVFLHQHPFCQDKAGCINPATDVHHIDGLGPLGPQGHDERNLMALCHSCHSRITSQEAGGAWGVRHD